MHMYDVIAVMLIGIGHVLLYIQLIRYHRLSYSMVVVVSIIFMLLLGIVVTVTGYPEFNIIMLLLFLLSLGLMKDELTFMHNLYFALVSIVGITYAKTVLLIISTELFMLSPLNLYVWTGSLIHLIVSFLILIIVILSHQPLQRFAQFIVDSRLYYVSYVVLMMGLFAGLIINYPTSSVLAVWHQQYGQISSIAAIILFFILLLIVLIGSHLGKERLLEEQQARLDKEMLDYVEKLELTHEELASFRHDYLNVLSSLDEGVRNKDLQQIEQVYYDVVAPTARLINNQELDIVKLSRVMIPEVKSVLSVKVISAQQQQIKVSVDIPSVIEGVKMPVIDFIRSISVLLDNAIEEAVHSEAKVLQIAFFEMDDCQYFIVKNSCQWKKIDLQKIYDQSYSSKDGDRGHGLFSLKRMIDKMEHVTLETSFIAPYFTQTLKLKQ